MSTLLNKGEVRKYFASTNNIPLLKELVDKLKEGAENYADHPMNKQVDVSVVDLLQIIEFSNALRRSINKDHELRDFTIDYIQASYCAVFSPANSKLAQNINHYLAILKPWQVYADILEVADDVIGEFVNLDSGILSKTHYPNFRAAVNKLIEFTDRSTVSRLVARAYGGYGEGAKLLRKRVYNKLVHDKVVDEYKQPEKNTGQDILKAIERYERHESPDPQAAVESLREELGGYGKTIIAFKLGEWFERCDMEYLQGIIKFGSDLYDEALAKEYLTASIEKAIYEKDWKKLDFAVEFLPENLIDKENPIIKTVILPAYQVIHNK